MTCTQVLIRGSQTRAEVVCVTQTEEALCEKHQRFADRLEAHTDKPIEGV